jgi:hypothetical protein
MFLCFILIFSCERHLDDDCDLIAPQHALSFDAQEGTDSSIVIGGYRVWFTDVQKEEECEFIKPEQIECPWFSAEIVRKSIIIASVKQNNTGQKRYKYVNIKGNDGRAGKCSENSGGFTIEQCPEPVDIKLSKEELFFGSKGEVDTITITTDRNSWLAHPLIGVQYENIHYIYDIYTDGHDFFSYSSKYSYINDLWFNVAIDGNKIIFSANKNESGKERYFGITIDPGNCGRDIKITQSAK